MVFLQQKVFLQSRLAFSRWLYVLPLLYLDLHFVCLRPTAMKKLHLFKKSLLYKIPCILFGLSSVVLIFTFKEFMRNWSFSDRKTSKRPLFIFSPRFNSKLRVSLKLTLLSMANNSFLINFPSGFLPMSTSWTLYSSAPLRFSYLCVITNLRSLLKKLFFSDVLL